MIRILTDSMSDLTQEDASRLGITVLPMPVSFGEEERWEGIDLSREEFFACLRVAEELPHTSQIAPRAWQKAFDRELRDNEDELLCITGSSGLTGGYQSALLARESCAAPERMAVVDSLNATVGQALLVEMAVRRRDAGATLQELVDLVEKLKARQRVFGQADDLKYLVMGGRLSPVVGKVGNALNIKPMLKIEGGTIDQAGLVRGAAKARAWYVEQLKKYPPDRSVPLLVAGADCPTETQKVKEYLEQTGLPLPPIETMGVGAVIGTHVGPGLIVMSWIEQA